MGAAVLALPLASAGSANAALAGANAPTTARPDLRSATILTNGLNGVEYCFDSALTNTALNGANFNVAGYRSASFATATSAARDAGNANCVQALFNGPANGNPTDLNKFSTAQVKAGAVTQNAGTVAANNANLADGTALSGSKSQSGTRGHTTGPDLIGVIPDATNNVIFFVFDENVDNVPTGSTAHFYTNTGANMTGVAAGVNNNVVAYAFGSDVTQAVRAYIASNQVQSTSSSNGRNTGNPLGSAAVPGSSGATILPDLTSATLSADGASVDFTYDQPVTLTTAGGVMGAFTVYESNGNPLPSTSATVVGPNTIRAQFSNTNQVNEYFVSASAAASAVASTSGAPASGDSSTAGGVPIGGNAGAFASGFTTGPDAFSTAFNTTGNTITITFDQRLDPAKTTATNIHLIDAAGNVVASGSTATTPQPGGPGTSTITVNFTTPNIVSTARAVQIDGYNNAAGSPPNSVGTFLTDCNAPCLGGAGSEDALNQEQILSPTATASILKVSKSGRTATLKRGVHLKKVKRAHRTARHHN